jgi:ABC-type Fe3+/spermidine/putrescine transport system ATPase subunit
VSLALECTGLTVAPGGAPVLRGVDFAIPAGGRSVLVGPSGAGKTTLLRAIAGLEPLAGGAIRLGERSLDGVPPHKRRIAVVFQEPRLLPHLSVADNVALPLRAAGVGRDERVARARARLEEVGLGGFLDRGLPGLSGGEQQRVALARALCAEPDLLLLDEPLAALDPNRREDLRRLIARLQSERALTTLIVTHDRAEAAELGERVALMLEGRIVQHDEPRALFERPVSAAVARFFGVANLLRGTVRDGRLTWGGGELAVPVGDGAAALAIRPEHVGVDPGSGLRGRVLEAVYAGTVVKLVLDCDGHRLEAQVPPRDAPAAGEIVGLDLPLEHLWPLPEVTASAAPARSAEPPRP